MDVRKWLTDHLTEMRFLGEYGSAESLPSDYVEKITRELEPAITKLMEALNDIATNPSGDIGAMKRAKAALAELEKP